MDKISLSDGEWKLMNLLWEESPLTIKDMVEALKDDTGWTRATVNIMLNRLSDKGAVKIDNSSVRKRYYPILDREAAVRQEAINTLSKIKKSDLGLLVNTMARESKLSGVEIDLENTKSARRNNEK